MQEMRLQFLMVQPVSELIKISNEDILNNVISIPTSASDNGMINGFIEGNEVIIKYWNSLLNSEYESVPYIVEGTLSFQKLSSVFIDLNKQVTAISNKFDKANIEVYPNPATTVLTVKFSDLPQINTEIILTDMTGKQIERRRAIADYETFDVQSIPSGIYFLKTYTGTDCETKKVIIN